MKKIDITQLSVPNLHALVVIHETGSLSRAATVLGVTQSTLSHTLKRLRTAFEDELFLRHARGIVATERCDVVVAGVKELLGALEALAEPLEFDPAVSTQDFTISCNFYERAVLLPALLRGFRNAAPNARLRVIQSNLQGHQQLYEGQCDLLVSPVPSETAGLYRRALLKDRYACFVDQAHPLVEGGMTLDAYAEADHIAVNYEAGWKPFYHAPLEELNISIKPKVELPSFGAIGSLIEGTDLVLTAPSGLAPVLMPRAAMLTAPFNASFEIYAFWNARQHASPANIWLRGLVAEAARAIKASAG